MSKDKNGLPDFTGPFRELIPQYVNYKRAQGYHLGDPILYRLREMDCFFKENGQHNLSITQELYEEFTTPKPDEKVSTTDKRRTAIRGFAKYLVLLGYEDIYTGMDDNRMFRSDFIPYVFSKEQIQEMFKTLAENCRTASGFKSDTFQMAMLLYYCCGFRKSEVQNLRIRDVDFETGKITVLNGKNDVSRIIVASDSLLHYMQEYQKRYLAGKDSGSYLISSVKGNRYHETTLYSGFHQMLTDAGIPPRKDGRRQRLHDVRHSFCVHTLEQMQEKGFDLYVSLPLLSVYLGHKHITETEYYLRMMEEHFGGILEKSRIYTARLFPESNASDGGDDAER